jgi:hypothetical protein
LVSVERYVVDVKSGYSLVNHSDLVWKSSEKPGAESAATQPTVELASVQVGDSLYATKVSATGRGRSSKL